MKMSAFLGVLFLVLCVTACASDGKDNGSTSGGGESKPATSKKKYSDDELQEMKSEYTSGSKLLANHIPVHGTLAVGQSWEVKVKDGANESTEIWAVAARVGRNIVIEQRTDGGLVFGYEITRDRSPEEVAQKGNVARGFVGVPGWSPAECKLKADGRSPAFDPAGAKGEAFTDVAVGTTGEGDKAKPANWSGTVYSKDDWKAWVADGAWFDGVIKMTKGSMTRELVRYGFDEKRKPWLKWDKVAALPRQ